MSVVTQRKLFIPVNNSSLYTYIQRSSFQQSRWYFCLLCFVLWLSLSSRYIIYRVEVLRYWYLCVTASHEIEIWIDTVKWKKIKLNCWDILISFFRFKTFYPICCSGKSNADTSTLYKRMRWRNGKNYGVKVKDIKWNSQQQLPPNNAYRCQGPSLLHESLNIIYFSRNMKNISM